LDHLRTLTVIAIALLITAAPAVGAQEDLRSQEEATVRAAVAHVRDSVVRIETIGGVEAVEGVAVTTGPTSGLIVSADGYIVSSAFNFVQQPTSILATLADGTRVSCEIVARDHSRMLVLLKANTDQQLPVPEAVPRDAMRPGNWAIAVGKTLSPNEPNISVGIISATNRMWGRAIQTDAKVSPTNYGGPLVDIQGRVLGVLVPLSPQPGNQMAGAEWYDSGIGFAVPLVDIVSRLESWKSGADLHAGVLGISMSGQNDYVDEAVIGVVRANSPAAKAGLQVGDKVVAAGGQTIGRMAHLKQVLGRMYAGDMLDLEVLRGDQRVTVSAQLVGELLPYAHPFLGVLPRRDAKEPGVLIRFVYPDSPAARAGIQEGDRLVALNGADVADSTAFLTALAQFEPNQSVTVRIMRAGQPQDQTIQVATLPEAVPATLPPAREPGMFAGEKPATGTVEVSIPEEAAKCNAFVPANYDPTASYSLLVWLNNGVEMTKLVEQWQALCEQHDVILLVPNAADALGWKPTDVMFVRKTIDHITSIYRIDPQRVVVAGQQVGGALAYLSAFNHRDSIRGVAVFDAALPIRGTLPENEPLKRLAVMTSVAEKGRLADDVEKAIERLRAQKFPVTEIRGSGQTTDVDDNLRATIVRWVDSLDRL